MIQGCNDKYNHGYSLGLNNNGNVLIIGAPEHGSNTTKGRAHCLFISH